MEAQVKAEKETGEKNIAQVHHMFFDLKACIAQICGPGETSELYFGLYNRVLFILFYFILFMN